MVTVDQVATFAVTSLLGAGGAGVLAQAIGAYRNRGKLRPEMDLIIAQGAKSAVESLQQALKSSDHENGLLRSELREQERRHQAEMDRMSVQLDNAQKLLSTAQAQIDQLRDTLAALKHPLS